MHEQSSAAYFSFYSVWIIVLIYGSFFFPFFPLSSPPKGIQAPQPAVSQPTAAFGHHWVSSYTHIRQTVCWDGLRHLGWRRESGSFLLSQKPYVSAPPTSSHSLTPSAQCFSLHWTLHVSTPFYPCSIKLFLFLTLTSIEEQNQWRNQILAQNPKIPFQV